MKNTIPRKFATLIENDVVAIDIVEARWGKEVTLSDSRKNKGESYSESEINQLRDFLKEYKETILQINNIKEQYSGVDEAWHIGKIAEEVISEKNITNGDFALITQIGYTNDGTYTGQMRNVYNVFPNQDYSQEHFGKSYMCELTQTVSDKTVQDINNNAKKYDIRVDKSRLRAIRDIYNSNDNIESSIENISQRKLFQDMDSDTLLDVLYDSYMLLGYTNISKTDIEKNIDKHMN